MKYSISFPNPSNHYVQVKIEVSPKSNKHLNFKLPVWTPGSYFIREYAQNVESVKIYDINENAINFKKTNKNNWQVECKEEQTIFFCYEVYAFNLSVRTSFVDEHQAYLNGASIFMYIEEFMEDEATLEIMPSNTWNIISTSLHNIAHNIFHIPNYDILVDSPIQVGNHQEFSYTQNNIKHRLAIQGKITFDIQTLINDIEKITKSATELMGENPCKEYLFIIHLTEKSSGGLEHLNSCTIQCNPEDYILNYDRFLRLIAHEYFHLWNVKRIKPKAFEKFDYNQENYTTLLWIAEGFTTYIELIILLKAKLLSLDDFWKNIQERIELVENHFGKNIQSLASSSFDAWIKAYRANENYRNSQISYYTKGSLIAMLIDFSILKNTNGSSSLIDVMRFLYHSFYQKGIGFSEKDIAEALSSIGKQDFKQLLDDYVYGTSEVNYKSHLNEIGLQYSLVLANPNQPSLEAVLDNNIIKSIRKNGTAYQAGLNVGDKIVAINGHEIKNIQAYIEKLKVGEILEITFLRKGDLFSKKVKLLQDSWKTCQIKEGENTNNLYKTWQKLDRYK